MDSCSSLLLVAYGYICFYCCIPPCYSSYLDNDKEEDDNKNENNDKDEKQIELDKEGKDLNNLKFDSDSSSIST